MTPARIILKHLPLRALKLGAEALGQHDPFVLVRPALREQLRMTIDRDHPAFPTEMMWQMLDFVPDVAGDLTGLILQADGVLDKIEEFPTAAFYVMTKRNTDTRWFLQLADRLQSSFEDDGELVAAYLTWIKHKKPPGVDFASYRRTLWRHPLHAIRWAIKENDASMGSELLQWAHENAHADAGAAWLLALSDGSSDPQKWRGVIRTNVLYIAASAASFGMQYTVDEFPDGMDGRSLFMLLRNNACADVKAVENLLREADPIWYLEWVITTLGSQPFPGLIGSEGLERMRAQNHPLIDTVVAAWKTVLERVGPKDGADDGDGDGDEEPRFEDVGDGNEGSSTNSAR